MKRIPGALLFLLLVTPTAAATGRVTTLTGRFSSGGLHGEEAARYFLTSHAELFELRPDLDVLLPDTTLLIKPAQALLAAGSALGAPLAGRRATSRLVIVEGDKEHPGFHPA